MIYDTIHSITPQHIRHATNELPTEVWQPNTYGTPRTGADVLVCCGWLLQQLLRCTLNIILFLLNLCLPTTSTVTDNSRTSSRVGYCSLLHTLFVARCVLLSYSLYILHTYKGTI